MRSPCGTTAAYMRHKRAGETPCQECKKAWREYYRDRRKRSDIDPAR